MPRVVRFVLSAFAWLALVPAVAYAQASVTGVVRDTSGAVLPGVTVEVASPVLIEKVRSGVTDGTGRYRIEELRPGTYSVTFTLPGFSTVKQDGLQLTGTFVATVNAELRVGALEETITVTGETPVVDVQSSVTQRVLAREVIDALPSGRAPSRLAALLPGVTTEAQDVGGLQGDGSARGDTTVHGVGDARMVINGMSNHTASGSRGAQGAYNMAAFAEMAVDTGGIGAEQKEGGVRINLIPKDGGNTFESSFLFAFANSSMQGDNFTQEVRDRGLSTPDSLRQFMDVNPAVGGPILRDKLWFHTTYRYNRVQNYGSVFFNKNAGNPSSWTYEPDTAAGPAGNEYYIKNSNNRLTWQAFPKLKLAFMYDTSSNCDCPRGLTGAASPEANGNGYIKIYPKRQVAADFSAPMTSRLLFEGGFYQHHSFTARPSENPYFPSRPAVPLIRVQDQALGLTYRGTATASENVNDTQFGRVAMSYITGAHAIKAGFQYGSGSQDQWRFSIDSPLMYRFNNGVPNRITINALEANAIFNMDADHGIFVQDRWTVKRLTLTTGLRYDYFHVTIPETRVGPAEFAPTRNLLFPRRDGVRWHNISPRFGVAYDLFGTGKTALKASAGRYLAGQLGTTSISSGTFTTQMAPVNTLVTAVNRSWNDANRNYVPDCDLINPNANGECGAYDNRNFGTATPGVNYDPDLLKGWQQGEYNWQFSAGVQHELLPRVSVDFGFYRTVFRNLLVQDNLAVSPADYDEFSITAPLDPRLPGGGGYIVGPFLDLKPASFGRPANNVISAADKYGKRIEHWNGFDISVTARPGGSLLLQGGTSTGRRTSNNCEILQALPEMNPVGRPWCDAQENWLTQIKVLSSYTIPRIDVLASATLQSYPGPLASGLFVSGTQALFPATNALVVPSLGRPLAGGASNVEVNIVEPGTVYSERMVQLDLRLGKVLRFGRSRTTLGLDVYNLLNADTVLEVNEAYANWLRPLSILNARFAKVILQFDF
jgi:hypothetical protein